MRHLAAITIGAGMVLALSNGPAGSTDAAPASTVPNSVAVVAAVVAAASGPVVPVSYALFGAPESTAIARHKPGPRCPRGTFLYKPKTHKGHSAAARCIGAGPGVSGYGTGHGTGTFPGTAPLPSPPIVTFGNGAGSGITTFGHSQGVNPNAGTGPFGHLGGTTVRQ